LSAAGLLVLGVTATPSVFGDPDLQADVSEQLKAIYSTAKVPADVSEAHKLLLAISASHKGYDKEATPLPAPSNGDACF
jgi:hypothetical protein